MKKEYIDLIDEDDNVLSKVNRKEVIEKNLLHRVAIVLVFNSKGEMLIIKRTKIKDNFPSYYAFGAGGIVSSGESYKEGAMRELEEELGIKNVKVKFLFNNKYITKKTKVIQKIYSCIYDGKLKLQKEEVKKVFFMAIDKINEFMKKEKFCPDLYSVFQKYLKLKK